MVHQSLSKSHVLSRHALLHYLIELMVDNCFYSVGFVGLSVDIKFSIFDENTLKYSLVSFKLLKFTEKTLLFMKVARAF
jgi:hypothetical protein